MSIYLLLLCTWELFFLFYNVDYHHQHIEDGVIKLFKRPFPGFLKILTL